MSRLSFGEYILDRRKNEIYYQDKPLELEPQIYGILELLITRHGEIVSRDEILNAVWDGHSVSNNVINNRIKSARAAIEDSGKTQRYIKTYPNRGYKFIGELSRVDETASLVEPVKLTKLKSSAPQPEPDTTEMERSSRKSAFSFQKSTALKVAAMALVGVIGFFVLSQTTGSGITKAPSIGEVNNEEAVYRLATSDDPNTLPRLAVLPFETFDERSDYGYLPEVLKSEVNNTITAIDGITVVGLSSGAAFEESLKDFSVLREEFDLDYVISAKMLPYGEAFSLNVSMVDVEDGNILYNEPFDLDISDTDSLKDLPAVIARKVTLLTANKLSLSVDRLPKSWENYDFYKKFQEAMEIGTPRDYEGTKKAAELLREVIAEEPTFVPAYFGLYNKLSWQRFFLTDNSEVLLKERAELIQKVNEIAPDAPETLIINAQRDSNEGGVVKADMGEYVKNDPVSVAQYVLKKDPDNLMAHTTLADMARNEDDLSIAIKARENALRLQPTHAFSLSEYSSLLYCNNEIDKARTVLDRASQWNPGHRNVLKYQIAQARARGEYDIALQNTKRLLDQGLITHRESYTLSYLFSDLGHPGLLLPHIRFEPIRAHIYALSGDKDAALEEAAVYERFYTSIRARMIVDETYFPENYSVNSTFRELGEPGPDLNVNACRVHALMRDTYVLKKIKSEKYEPFLRLFTEYMADKKIDDFRLQRDYTNLMGFYLLQGQPDKALEVLDIAIERGFHFIGSLKDPHLRDIASHPGFAERLDKMQKSADLLINEHYLN